MPERDEPDDQARILEALREARRASEPEESDEQEPDLVPSALRRARPDFEKLLAPRVLPISVPEAPEVEPIGPIEVVIAGQPERDEKRARGSAPYPRAAFNDAVRRLRAGEDIREISRKTKIHRNRIARIRDYYVFPRPDGPEYEAVAGPIPNTVILRRRS